MSIFRIVTSASHSQCLEAALDHLESLRGAPEVVVLSGTRGAADDFARACCRRRGGLAGIHRLTLAQLAADLATAPAAAHGLAPVSRLGLEALAARAVSVCRREGGLEYFQPVADTPGFPRALASTLTELRLERTDRSRLAATGASGRDLARLLVVYEKELGERSLADFALRLALATEIAARSPHRLLNLPLLLLDCAIGSKAEQEFAAAVARRSPDVFAAALAGDHEGTQALQGILGVEPEPLDVGGTPGALDRLRRYVFAAGELPRGELDPSVEFFSAPGEGLECVEIARRMRLLAAEGVAFDRMAVLLRHAEAYLPLVEDALRRAGIPGYYTRGVARPDPAGRAFLALLACAAENLAASRFAEYLSLGQVPAGGPPVETWVEPDDEVTLLKTPPRDGTPKTEPPLETDQSPVLSGTLRAPFLWERLLVDAAVIGGRDRWARRLRGLEQEYRLQLAELRGQDEPRREHLARQLERLTHLQQFALPLIDRLASLPASAVWGEWLERLRELAGAALKDPESVLSLLSELQPMDAVGPVDLDEVRGVLAERLSFLRREPPLRRYGRVFIGSIGEARGRCFDVVFLPGLAEGIFPRKAAEDPLLLDEYRVQIGDGLALQKDRAAQERLLLRIAAGAARSRFIASYPRMDVTLGRPRVPSFYALEIWRAAEGRLPEIRELEKRAAQAAPSQLGWPAPRDTAQAIDDAEYDLAFLDRLLRDQRGRAKGGARYLMEANPHLARSLRTRGRRWRNFWSEADGIVDPDPAALEILAAHGLRQRSYSPTALQHFAACPYRFLLHAVHRLRVREDQAPIEQLDPLTRGALFHTAQFELFRELQSAALLPVEAGQLGRVLDLADGVLNRVAAQYEDDLAPAIPRVWASEVEQVRIDLRGWMFEMLPEQAEWTPIHFEFGFGLADGKDRDPESRPGAAEILGGVRLRGSIDLIERHRARAALRVIDHKTGKAPERAPVWVGAGEILQPLFYGLAAEALLGETVGSGQLFYATQRGSYTRHEIELGGDARRRAALVADTIDQAVREGFLPAAPRKGACEYCDYRMVCGPYEELRVGKKLKDRIEPLQNLRNLP